MKVKAALIAVAVLIVIDAVAWHGEYRTGFERQAAEFAYWVKDQNWG